MGERRPPAHVVIEEHLRGLIAVASPGDPLPSDRELSARFKVSRMTARQAITTLVGEGRVYRVAGSGTYVAENPVHRRVTRLLSFTEHMRRQGRKASASVLASGIRPGHRQENLDLGQPARADVGYLRRVLLGDEVPIGIEDVLLPHDCSAVLDQDLASGSLYAALAAIGREPARSKGTLTAESADPDTARVLDVAVGAALIIQRQIVVDDGERPVELVVSRYVGDRFIFDIDQERHVFADPRENAAEPTYDIRALTQR